MLIASILISSFKKSKSYFRYSGRVLEKAVSIEEVISSLKFDIQQREAEIEARWNIHFGDFNARLTALSTHTDKPDTYIGSSSFFSYQLLNSH
jgi:hypothetical protein